MILLVTPARSSDESFKSDPARTDGRHDHSVVCRMRVACRVADSKIPRSAVAFHVGKAKPWSHDRGVMTTRAASHLGLVLARLAFSYN